MPAQRAKVGRTRQGASSPTLYLGRLMAVGAVAFVFDAGCLSPTLPLPPPALPTILPGSDADHVELLSNICGGAESGALIVVENENPALTGDQVGALTRADSCGRWDVEVYAHQGDVLQIWQEYEAMSSVSETVVVSLP